MNRSEFIFRLSSKFTNFKGETVDKAAQFLFDKIEDILVNEGRIEIRNFGSFAIRKRDSRIGRNPRTGEPVLLDGKVIPHFKPGKFMKNRIQNSKINKIHLKD